jgi:hypothetical protein
MLLLVVVVVVAAVLLTADASQPHNRILLSESRAVPQNQSSASQTCESVTTLQ